MIENSGLFVRKTIQRLVAWNLNFFFACHGNLKRRHIFDSSAFDNLYLERNTLGVRLAMCHFCAHMACRCVPIQKRLAIIVDELATSWKLNGVFVTRPNIDQVPPVKRLPIPETRDGQGKPLWQLTISIFYIRPSIIENVVLGTQISWKNKNKILATSFK